MKTVFIATAMAATASLAWSADIYTPVLTAIEAHNPRVKAAKARVAAELDENSTGLAPADPEVEFGYLWGTKSGMGHRKDVSVSQQFDFPTVYNRRREVAKAMDAEANIRGSVTRQQVLLQAKELCIQLIYANANEQLCLTNLNNARRMANAYSRMLAAGHTTQLEANKTQLSLAEAEAQFNEAVTERMALMRRLQSLNGGDSLAFEVAAFPAIVLPADPDSLCLAAMEANADLESYRRTARTAQTRVSLAKSLNLPKISVGYMGEFTPDEGWQGVKVGVSVPLWENRRGVRAAKAASIAAVSEYDDAASEFQNGFMESYDRAVRLTQTVSVLKASLSESDNTRLLNQALAQGEISLLQYLDELEFLLQAQLRLLEAERALALEAARLTAHEL